MYHGEPVQFVLELKGVTLDIEEALFDARLKAEIFQFRISNEGWCQNFYTGVEYLIYPESSARTRLSVAIISPL